VRWPLRRVIEELILFVFGIVWVFVIIGALQSAYPMFPLLFAGVIYPVGVVLLHLFLLWKVPPPKGRAKYTIIAVLGMMSMSLTVLLPADLGSVTIIFVFIGLAIWLLGLRYVWHREGEPIVRSKDLETPKSFLKKCIQCTREIPIASEECPFCKAKQP
jgi:hypothetical protein